MGGQVLGGGVIVLVAVVLWLVYLLPSWHSSHQYNSAERNAVRLNQALRVLAESSETPGEVRLELSARTALAQQKLARRAQTEREQADLETARRELAAARALPAAQRARARRRARIVTTLVGVAALGMVGWGAWEVVTTGAQVLLWTGVALAVVCALMLRRMSQVGARAATERTTDAVATRPRMAAPDIALADDRGWTPRSLPRPLVASAGSRAASEISAREAVLTAEREAELQARTAALRPEPPSIAAAREAREDAAAEASATASPYAKMGYVDDAEIEDHVRRLLARRIAG